MPNTYQPGPRKPQYGQNHKLSENRYAWVNCESGKFLILVGDDEGHGQDVVLYLPQPGKLPNVSLKLTDLTSEEHEALSKLFATAFEWAKPVVERRDKEAEDAWNEGDDSHSRNYRPLPTVVYRKRPVGEHGEGVHERPERVSESRGRGGSGDSGRVRGAGTELVEPDPDFIESKDDSSSPD